jgi:hypothetical protein
VKQVLKFWTKLLSVYVLFFLFRWKTSKKRRAWKNWLEIEKNILSLILWKTHCDTYYYYYYCYYYYYYCYYYYYGLNFPNALLNGGFSSVETLGFTAVNLAFTCRQLPPLKLS